MSSCYIPPHEQELAKQLKVLEDMLATLQWVVEERSRQEQEEQDAYALWKHTQNSTMQQRPITTWIWDSRVEVKPRTFRSQELRIG